MRNPLHLRRAGIALVGAALLLAGAAGANAVSGPQPGVERDVAAGPDTTLVNPVMAPGSELQFISVAPCRILDTRVAGGVLTNTSRVFSAVAPYTTQGGLAAGCGIPASAVSIQVNLGAIAQAGSTGWLKGWATGTAEPNATMLNFDPSGPVANMVTMPLSASDTFTLRVFRSAHVFADVAGYYVRPLYATIDGGDAETPATVVDGVASGLVSVTKESVGIYDLTFDRNVTNCVATASDFSFTSRHEISIDSTISLFNNLYTDGTIVVAVVDDTGAFVDAQFHVSLTC